MNDHHHRHGAETVERPDENRAGHGMAMHHDLHHQDAHAQGEHAGHMAHGGHGDHAGHADVFRTRFWVSLILSIPVVLFSPMVQDWLGYSLPSFPGDNLIAPVLGTFVFIYGGRVFLEGGWSEIKARQPEHAPFPSW